MSNNYLEYLYQAGRLIAKGKKEKALFYLEKATAEDPKHALAFYLKGSILREQGNFNESILELKAARMLMPQVKIYAAELLLAERHLSVKIHYDLGILLDQLIEEMTRVVYGKDKE